MEKKILRLLVVDDSPDDAEVVLSAFRKAGFLLKSQLVADLGAFQAAIEKSAWDVVVAEYAVPHFGAAVALEKLKQAAPDTPFVVFTRAIPDADLGKIMRAGAHDVVLKKEPVRLVPAVERELRVAAERKQYRQATQSLAEMENKHRAVIEGSREAICYSQDGMHLDANRMYLDIFGYESLAELEGVPVMNLIDKADHARFKEYIRKSGGSGGPAQEFSAVRQNGERFPAEITVSPITINGEACTQIVVVDVSKRKAVESKLQYLNQHDPLTGLYNRQYFLQELAKSVERAKQSGATGGIIYFDFHQMKQLNKQLGHATGDRLLLKATRALRETLGENVVLARIGDHEFGAILADAAKARLDECTGALKKTLAGLSFSEGGQVHKCDCHFATALIDKSVANGHKLLAGLYRSTEPAPAPAVAPKPASPAPTRAAAPRAEPATPATEATPPAAAPAPAAAAPVPPPGGGPKAPSEWHDRIATALAKGAFQLSYQPIINLHGDPAEYFEVLVRMQGRGDELIAAGQFMTHAVETGQAADIDRWVLRQALQALAELHREHRGSTFFVNVAPTALGDGQLLPLLLETLRETGVPARHLVLEIDESALTAGGAAAGAFVRNAKKAGVQLSVDNFGRDPAALNYLRDLPVDYLKIHGELVSKARDPVGLASLKGVVEVGKSIEKKVIAKNVESAETLSALWNLGIDYAQGNYFQQAEGATDYDEAETTLSESGVPNWAAASSQKRAK
ncbi:diguanylate phosphodiesterase [Sulfurifustis variabilis]|uniref:Diguanylate phosphodiesterase n=1 Tax=Sulfurifustis variabilis TaxID=1675686 RepID=A0A1B4VBA1_9GAMM|nr:EAL domain-containing protein [Sulfurifustis variabilis]BAU49444.1 diguanylate phosphodiesterase [Sulfurifustis variabilis]